MYLLDYAEPTKNGKKFRIATFFDPKAKRQKVVTKFLDESVKLPTDCIVNDEDLAEIQQVDVVADISGNVQEVTKA